MKKYLRKLTILCLGKSKGKKSTSFPPPQNQPSMIWVKSTEVNFASPLCFTNITILICQLPRKMCTGSNGRQIGHGPGLAAQWVTVSASYTNMSELIAGSISHESTHKESPMNA